MKTLKRILMDEKGATMIIVAFAIVMIFGFAVIAIDLSLIQLAKTQLQNAADAAALAGAKFLPTSWDSAKAEAIRVCALNMAIQDTLSPVLNPKVEWLNNENAIRVTTYRTRATDNPVTLYFLKVLNPLLENEGDVWASAKATFVPIDSGGGYRVKLKR